MNESFNQISLETLAIIFQICAAFSVGTTLLVMLMCFVGITFQMKSEACSKLFVTHKSNRFGLLGG